MSPIVLDVDQLNRRLLDQSGACIVRSKFKSLALASRGSDVVLYQSGRQPTKAEQETGYFAKAIIEDVFDHPSDEAKCIVWLKRLTYFRDTIPLLKDSGQGYEASLFDKRSNLIGWRAAEDLRRLPEMEFEHLAGAAGIAKEGLDESKSTFDTPEADIVPLPLFAKRFYQVRDASFARRIYTAYRGCCAISGLSLLSPDGRLCSLEAVHWYPHHFQPRTNIASGGLLALSWHPDLTAVRL
ncbi:MAG TPA: hypothetical protein VGB81_09460 [Devosia sp.]